MQNQTHNTQYYLSVTQQSHLMYKLADRSHRKRSLLRLLRSRNDPKIGKEAYKQREKN